jgi:hypothetical protein
MRWLCVAITCIACGGGRPDPEPPMTELDDVAVDDADDAASLSASACEPYVPPWSIGAETCAARAELLRKLYDGTSWDEPLVGHGRDLPEASDWKQLPGAGGQVSGPVIELAARGDGPAPPPPQLEAAGAAPEPYVIVLADAGVPMVELADLAAAVPGKQLRLGVRKPAAALLATHVERYPWTPDWVRDFASGCADLSLATIGPALEQAAAGCDGADRILEQLAAGAGIDVLGPLAAAALLNCECGARDSDGFAALLIVATGTVPSVGWVPLPDPLPRTGRVGEWVRSR